MYMDEQGYIFDDRIERKIFKTIERDNLDRVNGIVVHQTHSPTVQSTFNSYNHKNATGAHFLIDKDGKVYQTASIIKKTYHVGILKSRCILRRICKPTETALLTLHTSPWRKTTFKDMSNIEKEKNSLKDFLVIMTA